MHRYVKFGKAQKMRTRILTKSKTLTSCNIRGRLLSKPVNHQCTRRAKWKGLMMGSGRGKEGGRAVQYSAPLLRDCRLSWTHTCLQVPLKGGAISWLDFLLTRTRQHRRMRRGGRDESNSRVWVPFNSLDIPIKRVLLARPLFLWTSAISFLRPSIACIRSVSFCSVVRIRNICTTVKLPLFLFCLNNIYTLSLKYFPTNIIHHSPYTHTHRETSLSRSPISFGQQIDLSPPEILSKENFINF